MDARRLFGQEGERARRRDYAASLSSGNSAAGGATDAVVDSPNSDFASDSSTGTLSKRLGGAGGSDFFSSAGAVVGVDGLLPIVVCRTFSWQLQPRLWPLPWLRRFRPAIAAFSSGFASASWNGH
jgi:hypothetical protein